MPHLLFNFEPYPRHYIARLRHRQHLSFRSSQITIHPHRSCHPRRLPRYPAQTSISGPISVALLAFHFISSSLRAQPVGSLHQPCALSTSSVIHTTSNVASLTFPIICSLSLSLSLSLSRSHPLSLSLSSSLSPSPCPSLSRSLSPSLHICPSLSPLSPLSLSLSI